MVKLIMKGEWRFALMITGAQCVMISSQMWMPLLYADNWDLNHKVQLSIYIGRDMYVKTG